MGKFHGARELVSGVVGLQYALKMEATPYREISLVVRHFVTNKEPAKIFHRN